MNDAKELVIRVNEHDREIGHGARLPVQIHIKQLGADGETIEPQRVSRLTIGTKPPSR